MSDDIKWNKKKAQARSDKRERDRIKARIGKMYQDWKQVLCGQPRTPREVIQHLYKLKDDLMTYLAKEGQATMDDFRDFTVNLIEDNIARAIVTEMTGSNTITPALPEKVDVPSHLVPKPTAFKNRMEFMAIPWIAGYLRKSDFVGFLRKGKLVLALFSDELAQQTGNLPVVGSVSNVVGVEHLPSPDDFFASLAEKAKEKPENN